MLTARDLEIYSEADFENLPDEGFWEVSDGRATLLPFYDIDHQRIAAELVRILFPNLRTRGGGRVLATVNVDIPPCPEEGFRTRVPDLVVYETRPTGTRFRAGEPPPIVIEILATRRGNVERTEKIDDYARAGVLEYWLVDPFQQTVEVYRLEGFRYGAPEIATEMIVSTALTGLRIDLAGLFSGPNT
jgi:Uma2 family endonuclease